LLEKPEIRVKSKKKKRLDLHSRVALRERCRLAKKTLGTAASEVRSSSCSDSSDYDNLSSDKSEHLIDKYSPSLDLTAMISWEEIDHVLLTADEEHTCIPYDTIEGKISFFLYPFDMTAIVFVSLSRTHVSFHDLIFLGGLIPFLLNLPACDKELRDSLTMKIWV
jgi:hypothetical protein